MSSDKRGSVMSLREGFEKEKIQHVDMALLQERFQSMMSLTPGGMYQCYLGDPIHLEYASAGLSKMTGYTSEEFLQVLEEYDYCQMIHPDDRALFDEFCISLAKEAQIKTVEYRLVRKDGSIIYVSDTMESVVGEDGVMMGYSSVTDITKQKMEYQQLKDVHEHYVYNTEQIRNDLLSSALPGGMMGGYVDEGFPFYFVNKRMLDYLGYEHEEDFVQDINGLITNCMHPEDRAMVDREVEEQLSESQEYSIEYRMRKKSGKYIWVHDLGRKVIAENGKDAIVSVCYDITAQKEHSQIIEKLVDTMKGGMALMKVDQNMNLTPFYSSVGIKKMNFDLMGTNDVLDGNVLSIIYEEDKEQVRKSYTDAIMQDTVTSSTYRVLKNDGSCVWINATFSRFGEKDGYPVLQCVFTPVSMQQELQIKALSQRFTGIALIDAETEELYYANEASFYLNSKQPKAYTGKKCYEVYGNSGHHCEHCWQKDLAPGIDHTESTMLRHGRILSIYAEKRHWNDRLVFVEYINDITEKQQIQEMLKNSEETYDSICRFIGLWTWSFEIETGNAYPSKKMQEDFGMPAFLKEYPESFLEYGYVLSEDRSLYLDKIREIKDGAAEVEMVLMVHFPDKSRHWVRIRINRLLKTDTTKSIAVGSAIIIDREKTLEARIAAERQKLVSINPSLLRYVVINVSKNQITEHKEFRDDIAGAEVEITMEEMLSFVEKCAYHDESWENYREIHQCEKLIELYNSGTTSIQIDGQHQTTDGFMMWIRNSLHLLQDPVTNDIYLYEYAHNIHTEKIMEIIIEGAGDNEYERFGFLDLKNGQISLFRPAHRGVKPTVEIVQYEKLGQICIENEVLPEDREMFLETLSMEHIAKVLEECTQFEYNYRSLDVEGNIHYKKTKISSYESENKTCILALTDVTSEIAENEEQKNTLEAALKKATEASRAKSEFLARMSHDIRTPLNAILGLTALSMDETDLTEQIRENLMNIRGSGEFLLGLVNDILDMSQIEAGAVKLNLAPYLYTDFLAKLKTMFEPQCKAKNITFEFEEVTLTKAVITDKLRMDQIFFNILSNAVKFTPEGGRIAYYTDNIVVDAKHISADYIIEDNGIGMSEEFQKKIFQPFEQEDTKYSTDLKGGGLGLSIAKTLVALMGGSIKVESREKVGTKVTVHLGFELAEMSANSKEKDSISVLHATGDLNGKHVLLVEDHLLNAKIATRLLEKKGVIVSHAENGKIAVDVFAASEEGFFAAILMDIRMPVMDGLEATKAIRKLNRPDAISIPIIAMSANAFEEDVKKSLASGMNEHLAKPVDPQRLYTTLEEFV
ncbi:MAG: PAS domain-containing protein [Anaerostipes sp.]